MRRLLIGAVLGAAAARGAYVALNRRPPGFGGREGAEVWGRTNHRGEPVTLLEGPAFALGSALAGLAVPGVPGRLRAAALVAGAGSGAFGAYDDLAGSASSRGFKGHLSALARGEVTTGAVKILGIGASGLTAAALAGSAASTPVRRALDTVLNGAIVAASANLMNLFDLRPGRAIKVGVLTGAPLALGAGSAVVAAPLGAAFALLPEDLGERAMLGDAGANSFGALLGLGATRLPLPARLAVLGGLVALNGASEYVSFTKVIRETPALNWLDMLGRRPLDPAPAASSASASASVSAEGTVTVTETASVTVESVTVGEEIARATARTVVVTETTSTFEDASHDSDISDVGGVAQETAEAERESGASDAEGVAREAAEGAVGVSQEAAKEAEGVAQDAAKGTVGVSQVAAEGAGGVAQDAAKETVGVSHEAAEGAGGGSREAAEGAEGVSQEAAEAAEAAGGVAPGAAEGAGGGSWEAAEGAGAGGSREAAVVEGEARGRSAS
ncbi:hypothetical protein [Actinocorallia sp. A-T 12471]|uniref:hypothetical protein n=1 Tax=Actinocorallia sp. A-T 12471 TaxID=3089813 RepID=UPI0029D1923F|nr:hypothetical protein [Actinocorallia sp. A-T 12471]MDX6744909.1 hypothetical protein [Actinocorallia sp. A-T 12471]